MQYLQWRKTTRLTKSHVTKQTLPTHNSQSTTSHGPVWCELTRLIWEVTSRMLLLRHPVQNNHPTWQSTPNAQDTHLHPPSTVKSSRIPQNIHRFCTTMMIVSLSIISHSTTPVMNHVYSSRAAKNTDKSKPPH